MTETNDYAFYREQTIRLIRQDGANQARLDGHDEEIKRLTVEMKDGMADVKNSLQSQVGSLRAELLTRMDTQDNRRKEDAASAASQRVDDMAAVTSAIEALKADRSEFNKALSRAAWAIIAAVAAAAAAQAALSPQIAGMATQAIGQLQ